MNREDIIKLAREAAAGGPEIVVFTIPELERFTALVADAAKAEEREVCAKVCEENADDLSEGDWDPACINCANAIRKRSNT